MRNGAADLRGLAPLLAVMLPCWLAVGCQMDNPAYDGELEVDAAGGGASGGGASGGTAAGGMPNTLLPDASPPVSDGALPQPDLAPATAGCASVPELILCLPFEGDGLDHSVFQHQARLQNGTFTAGPDGQALVMSAATSLRLDDAPTLNVDRLTMELWLKPRVLPSAGQRYGLLDREPDFGLFLLSDGRASCKVNGVEAISLAPVPAGVWSSIACSYDRVGISLYVGGRPEGGRAFAEALRRTSTVGVFVGADAPQGGSRFDGQLDNVRMWSRARSTTELCASAVNCQN